MMWISIHLRHGGTNDCDGGIGGDIGIGSEFVAAFDSVEWH